VTAPYGDADLAFVLKDCGVPVSTPRSTGNYGVFDKADRMLVDDQQRGQVNVTVPSVTVQASAYPAGDLEIDQPIVVDGVNYAIRDHEADSDGALKKLYLRKA
jgi:type IV secretory pathway protease TraF